MIEQVAGRGGEGARVGRGMREGGGVGEGTRSELTNMSLLTWRHGIHLHDAYATALWVVPNKVTNQCNVVGAQCSHGVVPGDILARISANTCTTSG